jgi:tetratricopeptide (TPR) repeat protein
MKTALTALGVLLGLALVAPPAQAQMGGARGKVVDTEGTPVAEATVLIEFPGKPDKYEVKTDKKGEYLQIGLEPGYHRITASKDGYIPGARDARIGLGITDIPSIELEAAPPPPLDQATLNDMFAKAVQLTQDGQLDEAEAAYREILDLQPGLAEALGNLGYVYAKKEDWEKAEASYLQAIEQRPDESKFTLALAQLYRDSGQTEKADALTERIIGQEPVDATDQINRGVFLLNSGRTEDAQKAFEDALATDPSAAVAHYHLGTLLVGQGKADEAIQHLEAYLASNPGNSQYVATAQGLLEALKK